MPGIRGQLLAGSDCCGLVRKRPDDNVREPVSILDRWECGGNESGSCYSASKVRRVVRVRKRTYLNSVGCNCRARGRGQADIEQAGRQKGYKPSGRVA
jgi:hypothetical protein